VVPDRQAMGPAAAGTAGEQAEDQTGLLGRAAIVLGVDAEGAVEAMQPRRLGLAHGEARVPHQRAVGEDPERLVPHAEGATEWPSRSITPGGDGSARGGS